jgi:hypothetical protein
LSMSVSVIEIVRMSMSVHLFSMQLGESLVISITSLYYHFQLKTQYYTVYIFI